LFRPVVALLALALVPAWSALQPTDPAVAADPLAQRPNIVLITTDDQRVDDMRYMPFTRSLIGGQGTTFTDAVAPFPLCCPSRAVLLTGQFNHNNGVLANLPPDGGYQALRPLNSKTLPVWLQNAGYTTTFTGKYLNGYGMGDLEEVPEGWTDWKGSSDRVYDFYSQVVNDNGTLVHRDGDYVADVVQEYTESAIVQGAATRRPFFVWQSNLAPHKGCSYGSSGGCTWGYPKPAEQDEGDFASLPLVSKKSPAFNERAVADKPRLISRRSSWRAAQVDWSTRLHQARVRSLQAVDRNVRDTVRLLDQLGELDNTLIIFTSDNGFLLGEHRYSGKTLAYEESLTVPLMMRGPGVPVGARTGEMVALVDVARTIAEVAGATPLLKQDGRSLMSVATGGRGYAALGIEAGAVEGAPSGTYLYQGVRTKRYVYLRYPNTREVELYDRRVDPDQSDNVAYRPTHRAVRKVMAGLLEQVRDCAGVSCRNASARLPAPEPPQGPVHPDELARLGDARQLVTVTANRWAARAGKLVAWQKKGRSWRAVRGPLTVRLGANGMARGQEVSHERSKTRAGLFAVERALGLRPDPGGELRYRRLDKNDRWPYDRLSRDTYNVLQPKRSASASWRAGQEEIFSRTPEAFAFSLVLDHNLPRGIQRAPKRDQLIARQPADVRYGSLLLHTGSRLGRHGWMSVSNADARWLVQWMRPRTQETRVAIGTPGYLRSRL
jgi:arylsulfatase A-like enzyme/L,D-peptidoglycan transpeptidase YkuD (ErfK/YbiS/YcfS/YnhG family)